MNKSKKIKLFLIPLIVIVAYFIYTIPSTFSMYKSVHSLTSTLNISKPIFKITLDNQSANVQGTTAIYVKHSIGFYLNSDASVQMTTTTNSITIPNKDGYSFKGYYTQTNGLGTQYIDENGKLTSNVNSSNFTSNDTLYAYYINSKSNIGKDCSNNDVPSTIPENATGLYKIIAEQAYLDNVKSPNVTRCEGVDFNDISSDTNGKGVYEIASTKDDPYPIYYYRGAVTNNNVIFGGFCWKAVRTTDTGGVKLVYNGRPDLNGQCTNTTGEATQIKTSAFNEKDDSVAYVGYMYGTKDGSSTGTPYTFTERVLSDSDAGMKFGRTVTYSSGTYTLTNTIDLTSSNYNQPNSFDSNHYTCFSESDTCTAVNYVYNIEGSTYYYITIEGVNPNGSELIDVVKESMFRNDRDSTAKVEIENWYRDNMTSFTSKLEDTIYCNDRSIFSQGGWEATGDISDKYIGFNGLNRTWTTHEPSLVCERELDKFTVSSSIGNGKLKYPVGLLTTDEIIYAGERMELDNTSYYLYTNQLYWTNTPYRSGQLYVRGMMLSDTGKIISRRLGYSAVGLRPVISLSKNVNVTSGDGSMANPYTIDVDNIDNPVDNLAGSNTVENCSGNHMVNTIPKNATGLYKIMAEQAYLDNAKSLNVTRCEGVDFNDISSDTNGKGVYEIASTKDNPYPIYYYRGAVTNNNVKFGEFCWKAVRTTDTGGVKLVYNGRPDLNGQCTNTTGETTQIKISAFNENNEPAAYIGYMYGTKSGRSDGTPYTFTERVLSASDAGMKFGNTVTYSSGTYTLTNTIDLTSSNYNQPNSFDSNHYTCFSESNTCTAVNYVYNIEGSTYYYITIEGVNPNGGELIDVVKESMFRNDRDSTAKIEIEKWYSDNMTTYTSKLEDTIYCSDRSISSQGGWKPTGSMTSKYLRFSGLKRVWSTHEPSLVCERELDKFTVSETKGNGKLAYPVGLLTVDEIMYAGGKMESDNTSYYLYTNQSYWSGTPYRIDPLHTRGILVADTGHINNSRLEYSDGGLRPVVSISKNTTVTGGDGTANSPYVIE